jgi:hypothetical protein
MSSENIPNFDNIPQRQPSESVSHSDKGSTFGPPPGNTGWQADFSGSSFPTTSSSNSNNSFFGNPGNPQPSAAKTITPTSFPVSTPTSFPMSTPVQPVMQPALTPQAAPTQNTSQPKSQKKAKVAFGYTAEETNEIDLVEGDIITIVAMDDSGWWTGITSSGKEGLFPGNYVQILPDTPQTTSAPTAQSQGRGGPVLTPSSSGNTINTTIPASNPAPARNTVKVRKCVVSRTSLYLI